MPRRDSKYWRQKAEEARTRAERFRKPDTRTTMENISHAYDLMAERAEEREKRNDLGVRPQGSGKA